MCLHVANFRTAHCIKNGRGLDPARGTFKDHTSSLDIGVSANVRRISKFTLPRENTRHFNILNVFTRDSSDAVGMCAERMSGSLSVLPMVRGTPPSMTSLREADAVAKTRDTSDGK